MDRHRDYPPRPRRAANSAETRFAPDPLTAGDTWVSAATALPGQTTCSQTGTWLVAEAWVQSWSVPVRPVSVKHEGSDTVRLTLRQLKPGRKINAPAGCDPPLAVEARQASVNSRSPSGNP